MNKESVRKFFSNKRNRISVIVGGLVIVICVVGGIIYYISKDNKESKSSIDSAINVEERKVYIEIKDDMLFLLDSNFEEIANSTDNDKLYSEFSNYFDKQYSFYWKKSDSEIKEITIEKGLAEDFLLTCGVEGIAVISKHAPTASKEIVDNSSNTEDTSDKDSNENSVDVANKDNGNNDSNGNNGAINNNSGSGNKGNHSVSGGSGNQGGSNNTKPDEPIKKPEPTPNPEPPTTPEVPKRTWKYRSDLSSQTFSLINDYRSSLGIPTLTYSSAEQQRANQRAEANARNHCRGHDRLQLSIYGNMDSTASQFLTSWKQSPAHNGFLQNTAMTVGAVSVYEDTDGYFYVIGSFNFK